MTKPILTDAERAELERIMTNLYILQGYCGHMKVARHISHARSSIERFLEGLPPEVKQNYKEEDDRFFGRTTTHNS